MKGCKPAEYRLGAGARHYLRKIVKDGPQLQRVARRAHILLALDRGERIVEIMRWLRVSRMGIWPVWQRYPQRGVAAIFDEERSGRPVVFSPAPAGANRAGRLYRPRSLRVAVDPLGLPQSAATRG
jgi:Winged helix-turn helix